MKVAKLVVLACVLGLSVTAATAQEHQGIKSTPLLKKPVTGVPDKEMTILSIELQPGGASGLHTHPGDEHGTVIEGTLMVKVGDGDYKPVAVGETFTAPPNTPMGIQNTTDKVTRVINVLILEKGKPAFTPVKHR